MNLAERGRALKELGFLQDVDDMDALAHEAAQGEYDPRKYPATALLATAGELLEIPLEALEDPGDYEAILMAVEEFCGEVFTIEKVQVFGEELGAESDEGDGEADIARVNVVLRFEIDGTPVEARLQQDENYVDLNFLQLIDEHLQDKGDDRRICPIVEVMDDTARYVFIEPSALEKAELEELVTAPDFEED